VGSCGLWEWAAPWGMHAPSCCDRGGSRQMCRCGQTCIRWVPAQAISLTLQPVLAACRGTLACVCVCAVCGVCSHSMQLAQLLAHRHAHC
jgi:hypothetical protein